MKGEFFLLENIFQYQKYLCHRIHLHLLKKEKKRKTTKTDGKKVDVAVREGVFDDFGIFFILKDIYI